MSSPFAQYDVTDWLVTAVEPEGDDPKYWRPRSGHRGVRGRLAVQADDPQRDSREGRPPALRATGKVKIGPSERRRSWRHSSASLRTERERHSRKARLCRSFVLPAKTTCRRGGPEMFDLQPIGALSRAWSPRRRPVPGTGLHTPRRAQRTKRLYSSADRGQGRRAEPQLTSVANTVSPSPHSRCSLTRMPEVWPCIRARCCRGLSD